MKNSCFVQLLEAEITLLRIDFRFCAQAVRTVTRSILGELTEH